MTRGSEDELGRARRRIRELEAALEGARRDAREVETKRRHIASTLIKVQLKNQKLRAVRGNTVRVRFF